MRILIVEDELVAQQALARMLERNFPDIEIGAVSDSVQRTVDYLASTEHYPDIIFMDVELSDGKCFEIFERTEVKCPVVMITAYDNYAINAFNAGSVDYLLKPINVADLQRAIERCRKHLEREQPIDIAALRSVLAGIGQPVQSYKQRHLLRYNDKIVMVETANIAYFYSEEGSTYLMTNAADRYLMDESLDVIYKELDPTRFFRISRSCIVSSKSVGQVVKKLGNRLKLTLKPASNIDSFVSRAKTADFMEWLEKCSM